MVAIPSTVTDLNGGLPATAGLKTLGMDVIA
jgi:hypothetical protein